VGTRDRYYIALLKAVLQTDEVTRTILSPCHRPLSGRPGVPGRDQEHRKQGEQALRNNKPEMFGVEQSGSPAFEAAIATHEVPQEKGGQRRGAHRHKGGAHGKRSHQQLPAHPSEQNDQERADEPRSQQNGHDLGAFGACPIAQVGEVTLLRHQSKIKTAGGALRRMRCATDDP
jgi:hypothetical protein